VRVAFEITAPLLEQKGWREARGVSQVEIVPAYSYHPSRDPLRDPAALLGGQLVHPHFKPDHRRVDYFPAPLPPASSLTR